MSIGDVNSTARGSGARYNDGKVAFDLIPGMALEDCARVFDYGRKKYAAWNWAKGMQWMVVFGCILRHLYAWARGEDNDPESGLPHLGHAMCNLVMLTTFARTYREGDDRPKGLFETVECGGCAPPVQASPRQLYDETTSIAAAQDTKLDDHVPHWDVRWGKNVPAESAYLASFSPNADIPAKSPKEDARIATPAEVDLMRSILTAEELKGFTTSQHPMAAEGLRDEYERGDKETGV